MNNTTELMMIRAILIAATHAVVAPLVIMTMVNLLFAGNWGFVIGLAYLFVPGVVYTRAKNKDISKMVFFGILKLYGVLLLFFAIMIIA